MAMIKWSIVKPNTENVTIEVDETVEALQLEINGTFSSSNILLRNPNGNSRTSTIFPYIVFNRVQYFYDCQKLLTYK